MFCVHSVYFVSFFRRQSPGSKIVGSRQASQEICTASISALFIFFLSTKPSSYLRMLHMTVAFSLSYLCNSLAERSKLLNISPFFPFSIFLFITSFYQCFLSFIFVNFKSCLLNTSFNILFKCSFLLLWSVGKSLSSAFINSFGSDDLFSND